MCFSSFQELCSYPVLIQFCYHRPSSHFLHIPPSPQSKNQIVDKPRRMCRAFFVRENKLNRLTLEAKKVFESWLLKIHKTGLVGGSSITQLSHTKQKSRSFSGICNVHKGMHVTSFHHHPAGVDAKKVQSVLSMS